MRAHAVSNMQKLESFFRRRTVALTVALTGGLNWWLERASFGGWMAKYG